MVYERRTSSPRRARSARRRFLLATGLFAGACAGPVSTDADPSHGALVLSPPAVELPPGDTIDFSIRTERSPLRLLDREVTWGATGGRIDSAGMFVAGEAVGSYTVTARIGELEAQAFVTVADAGPEDAQEPVADTAAEDDMPDVGEAPPPPAGEEQPSGPAGSWTLTLEDDFDGTSLRSGTWTPHYAWWPTTINGELQYFDPDRPTVSGGTLKLTADRTAQNGYDYTSGAVSSHGKFSMQFGVAEMRARLPAGTGLWPAFWMMPEAGGWPPEIDIMENIGDPGRVHFNLHFAGGGNMGAPSFDGLDTRQWHTYTVHWRSDRIDWYVDGVLRASYTNQANIPQQPMYLLLNLAVGGSWPGAPDASTAFPATYEIDYVRAWQ